MKAFSSTLQVFTDSMMLPDRIDRPDLRLHEVARFSRPSVFQIKHQKIVLFRVEGWELSPPPVEEGMKPRR